MFYKVTPSKAAARADCVGYEPISGVLRVSIALWGLLVEGNGDFGRAEFGDVV